MFAPEIEHDVFKSFKPVSAGFCEITGEQVLCFGESHSLNLKSDEKKDTLDATKHVFGIDAMIKLM